jgi:hypothetical protein
LVADNTPEEEVMNDDNKQCSSAKPDTEDLKKAVDATTDESASSQEKGHADRVLEKTAKDAKKAEAFPTEDKSVTLERKS